MLQGNSRRGVAGAWDWLGGDQLNRKRWGPRLKRLLGADRDVMSAGFLGRVTRREIGVGDTTDNWFLSFRTHCRAN
jgi:hypothetical protein